MEKQGLVAELIGAALLIAVGGTMAIMSLDYGLLADNGQIRPGFTPFVSGGLMALFGVAVGISVLRQHSASRASAREAETDPSTTSHPSTSAGPSTSADTAPVTAEAAVNTDEEGGAAVVEGEMAERAEESLATDAEAADRAETGEAADEGNHTRVAVVFGLTLITILVSPILGFVPAFGVLVFVLLSFVERERLWVGLLVSVTASVATWLIFVYFLRIPLPSGIF